MNPSLEIAVTNRVLNPVLSRGWKDYDSFSSKIARHIIKGNPHSKKELIATVKSFKSPFFGLNKITANVIIEVIPLDEILELLSDHSEVGPLPFQIFLQKPDQLLSLKERKVLLIWRSYLKVRYKKHWSIH